MLTLEEIHEYWANPTPPNEPKSYILGMRSDFLIQIFHILPISPTSDYIVELGCNVGRNLDALFKCGYRQLRGIEMNRDAKPIMRRAFPDVYYNCEITWASIEKTRVPQCDVVFTMAVLEHIHPDSEWIFEEMVKQTRKFIITIEDEWSKSPRHFPRDYQRIFEERFGMRQLFAIPCGKGVGGELDENFHARVFSF